MTRVLGLRLTFHAHPDCCYDSSVRVQYRAPADTAGDGIGVEQVESRDRDTAHSWLLLLATVLCDLFLLCIVLVLDGCDLEQHVSNGEIDENVEKVDEERTRNDWVE